MSGYILKFAEIGKEDIAKAGGKGANLGEMAGAGMAVPDGFVLTADAYRRFIFDNSVLRALTEELGTLEQRKEKPLIPEQQEEKLLAVAARLREQIMNCALPEEIRQEVSAEGTAMGDTFRAAVRSSATAEDLADASFAGQQETFLNIRGTEEIEVSADRQAVPSLSNAEAAALCAEGGKIEEHYNCPMDIEWAVAGGKVYILQARAVTTLKEEQYDEALLESYVNRNPLSGMLKKNMSFLLEKLPAPMYPLDEQMVGAINNQKAVIFAEIGLEMSMQPEMDDDGITWLPKAGKKITGNIIHFPAVLKEVKDTEGCRRITERKMAEYKTKLEEIASLPFAELNIQDCGKQTTNCVNYVSSLAYDRFKYGMFSSFFCGKQFKKAMKAGKVTFTGDDLYSNLDYRTAVVSRRMSQIADEIRQNPEAANAIRKGAGYEAFLTRYPEYKALLEGFLAEHGMKSDYNCYCLYAKAFLEEPDRVIRILRPLIDHPSMPEEDKFGPIMAQLEAVTAQKNIAALRQDVDTLRYFHVQREESQYLWESAFFYQKKILARAAELLCGDSDFRENVAFLFLPEFLEACARGVLSDSDREKIARRKKNRPFAYAVWERCKLKAYDRPSDVLKGVGGSVGETIGKVCVIRGPEEFYKMEKDAVMVCPYTDPEWTPLFSLANPAGSGC